ncbi:TlpA family protein disulfide reductase [Epilithonimonas tenax]|uniref:TlpA family protein disulfide reductase n=1 Tax=Epilithonimonas tenax TaxID=191577 RepID=UPI0003FDB14F|nr:TlpA disulfide reductase family protein [Epilithonimonas tenax]
MNKIIFLFLILAIQSSFCQKVSSIEILAPDLKMDSLFLGYPSGARNTHLLHKYNISTTGAKKLDKQGDMQFPLKEKVTIITHSSYPQPAHISSYNRAENTGMASKTFFIEDRNLKLLLKDDKLNFQILSSTPANMEYDKLKVILEKYNTGLKPYESNEPQKIEAKELELQNYIRKNPGSYVALWEMVDDFSRYGYHPVYFDNLKLFHPKVKKTFTFVEFSKLLKLEADNIFPEVTLDNNHLLSRDDFKNYKLTLIDYWSTTCKPCIEDMPKLVELYGQYKEKGINFISVTDEQTPERIKKAHDILKNNKITWDNYFDKNKEFPKKLNASGYPLQILIDSNGNIVKRTYGELQVIQEFIRDYLMQ